MKRPRRVTRRRPKSRPAPTSKKIVRKPQRFPKLAKALAKKSGSAVRQSNQRKRQRPLQVAASAKRKGAQAAPPVRRKVPQGTPRKSRAQLRTPRALRKHTLRTRKTLTKSVARPTRPKSQGKDAERIIRRRPLHIAPRPGKRTRQISDHRFQAALKSLQQGRNTTEAAREIGVSRQRLEQQLRSTGAARKRGARWIVLARLPRRMALFTTQGAIGVTLRNRREASKAGLFMSAVSRFLFSNEPSEVETFSGEFAMDIQGRRWAFETDPNILHQLAHTGNETFESVYRIVV